MRGASCCISTYFYMFVGCSMLLFGGVLLKRKLSRPTSAPTSSISGSEKLPILPQEQHPRPLQAQSYAHVSIHPPRPLPELPFTPPTLFTQAFESLKEEKGLANEYYDSPTEMESSSFDSFEQAKNEIPRRRSYTKSSKDGSLVSGEIIQVCLYLTHSLTLLFLLTPPPSSFS